MKILVYGVGALGSLTVHYLMKAGNAVTVVARSTYEELRTNGLVIQHYLQNQITVDYPEVVREADTSQHYDIVFSVLQGQQQNALLETFAALDTGLIVLIGNNMDADRQKYQILKKSAVRKNVLFGFQNSAGHREPGMTVSAHLPQTELVIGRLHQAASQKEISIIREAFHTSSIHLTFYDDMYAYYLCHIAEIMPYAYLCCILSCDLKRASAENVREVMQASHEAFEYLKSVGVKIVPPNEEKYYEPGIKYGLMYTLFCIINKTVLGQLMVSDHCQNGRDELIYLDRKFTQFRRQHRGSAMPFWDKMQKQF